MFHLKQVALKFDTLKKTLQTCRSTFKLEIEVDAFNYVANIIIYLGN